VASDPATTTGMPRSRAAGDHRQRRLPHPQQAHLAQVVEVVFVNHRKPRCMAIERRNPFRFGFGEHRVEQCNAIAALTGIRSGVERAERRIRLLGVPQLGIETQKIRLAEQHVDRRRR
jgi:hypothetical protein